jgi:hypothetical protein
MIHMIHMISGGRHIQMIVDSMTTAGTPQFLKTRRFIINSSAAITAQKSLIKKNLIQLYRNS